MKATDLMIGDYVTCKGAPQYPECPILQVKGLVGDESYDIYISEDGSEELDIYGEEDIQPIPLTDEILEKNGFELEWWWRLKGEDLWLSNSRDEYRVYANQDDDKRDNFCWIGFVHELQHVLNLLKIDKQIIL